jgi:hypothetical protein
MSCGSRGDRRITSTIRGCAGIAGSPSVQAARQMFIRTKVFPTDESATTATWRATPLVVRTTAAALRVVSCRRCLAG